MGANAQTAVPTFTASQVLTAAQMNQSARTGVPVFATTTDRDAAFGGTGEKTLAEGQLCYVETTGLQSYNGTAWVTWGATNSVQVTRAKTSFSAASTITADNVFTTGYEHYRVVINYTTSGSNNLGFVLRVGGVNATSNYNLQYVEGSITTLTGAASTSRADMIFCFSSNGSFNSSAVIDIFQPNVATPTVFTALNSRSGAAYTSPIAYLITGNHSTATAYDGFQLAISGGQTATGNYTVYGWRS